MPTKQQFVDFIQQQQFWNDVWTLGEIEDWANGKEMSSTLDKLYSQFASGNATPTVNFIYEESGHNLDRPDWIDYKTDGFAPEEAFLHNAILDLSARLQQYQSNGGENAGLINTIKNQIASFQSTLQGYGAQDAADQTIVQNAESSTSQENVSASKPAPQEA